MQKQVTWRGSLLLVVTLSVGVAIAWGVAVNWTHGVLSQFQPRESTHRDIVVRIDGEPLIQTRWGRYEMQYRHETLSGKPLEVDRYQLWTLQGAYLSRPPRSSIFYFRPPWNDRLLETIMALPQVILSGFADEAANHKTAVEQFAAFAALGNKTMAFPLNVRVA